MAIEDIRVVGIGEIFWDMLQTGRRLGGAPTNFAYHVHALGIPATVVSAVGGDANGHLIIDQVTSWGLDANYISVLPGDRTGVVQIELNPSGGPRYIIEENVAWDHIPFSKERETLARSLRAVCFGTLGQRGPVSRAAIRDFVQATPPDCLRICDINLRQHFYDADLLRTSLEMATIAKLNDEELPVVAGSVGIIGDTEALLHKLRDRFDLQLIALTRGSSGSVLLTADKRYDHPGVATTVIDTVGAGDAFTAALTVGLLRGDDPKRIQENANWTAARVCSHSGAIPIL